LLWLGGADVVVFDPHVTSAAIQSAFPALRVVDDIISGAAGADVVVLATEWSEFAELPLHAMAAVVRTPLLIDGRNFLDAQAVRAAGFAYRCIGRPGLEGEPLTDVADEQAADRRRLAMAGRE